MVPHAENRTNQMSQRRFIEATKVSMAFKQLKLNEKSADVRELFNYACELSAVAPVLKTLDHRWRSWVCRSYSKFISGPTALFAMDFPFSDPDEGYCDIVFCH